MDNLSTFIVQNNLDMNISLTKKQENYISEQLESGDFQNASELVRDALRLHEIYRHRIIEDLRKEIEKGWSGKPSQLSINDLIESKKRQRQS